MKLNRSMPDSSVIPVLAYPDVPAAIDWLCKNFGFTLRWKVADHRAQLNVFHGCVALTKSLEDERIGHSVMVRVEDINAHYEKARGSGAQILQAPADYPYGERQYSIEDLAGHIWTFSQTIADVAPEDWGGVSMNL
jgi:uncharacterized glyoxalase superfamily protein PhnB